MSDTGKYKKSVFERFLPFERQLRGFLQRRSMHVADAEDLTQEVFLRAFRASKKQEIENPKAFLFGVARNVMLADSAKKTRSIISSIEDLSSSSDFKEEISTEEDVESREKWQIFADATAELPPQCQKVFVLKKVYGFANKDIAVKLGISISTVEKHIASGLRRVRETMLKSETEENNKQGNTVVIAVKSSQG